MGPLEQLVGARNALGLGLPKKTQFLFGVCTLGVSGAAVI